jgi:hypothetical protein
MANRERRAFPHNDMQALDRTLAAVRGQYDRVLIVAEGLYSMDGDICDLPALIGIKDRRQAWLMIDDAAEPACRGAASNGSFGRNRDRRPRPQLRSEGLEPAGRSGKADRWRVDRFARPIWWLAHALCAAAAPMSRTVDWAGIRYHVKGPRNVVVERL